jgi:rod shape-determining protein MreD
MLFSAAAAILQSTLLSYIALYRVVPDLALVVIVFSAYVNGSMTGQLSGFFSGILLDFLSAAPLGLNALIRTLTGAITGLLKGVFFLDIFLLPMILCAVATLFKALCLLLLHLLLGDVVPVYPIADPTLWIELGLNTVCGTFLFALLRIFNPIFAERRKR